MGSSMVDEVMLMLQRRQENSIF